MGKKIKKAVIILCFGILISCSSVGKRVVPNSAVVSRDTVVNNSIVEVNRKFNEEIESQNVGLYKKGYGIAYVNMTKEEDGKIVSSERFDYK